MAERREPNGLESRLARIETSFDSLAFELRAMREEIKGIRESQKPNYFLFIGVATLLIGTMSAIGSAWITPVTLQISQQKEAAQDLTKAVSRTHDDIRDVERSASALSARVMSRDAALKEKVKEIESQFAWDTDISNVRFRNYDRMIAILWGEVFKKPLPEVSLPSAGPNRDWK